MSTSTPQPTVVVRTNEGNIFDGKVNVAMDGIVYFNDDLEDLVEAVSSTIACYYAFDTSYPATLRDTMCFIDSLILKHAPSDKLKSKLRRAYDKITV